MSHAFGLVKFKTTGNIYFCCYNGTSDIMLPYLCTSEECYDEKFDFYNPIAYCQKLREGKSWSLPEDTSDLVDVEIYSDYGGGFYWDGTGSESARMINDYLNPFDEVWETIHDGIPDWASKFLKHLGIE